MRLTCSVVLLLATPVISIRMAEEEARHIPPVTEPRLLSCWSGCSRCLGQEQIGSMFRENKQWNVEGKVPSTEEGLDDISCVFDSNLETFISTLTLNDISVEPDIFAVVTGATLAPANEKNERNTLLLVGQFELIPPTRVSIKGAHYPPAVTTTNFVDELSCEKTNNGPRIQWAKLSSIDENEGENDECSRSWEQTTHVVQVAFSANIYLSYNSSETASQPLGEYDKDMFLPDLGNGFTYLGMADLDGDNFIDLCLRENEGGVRAFGGHDHWNDDHLNPPKKLTLRSELTCKYFVEGNCGEISPNLRVRSQEICVSDSSSTSCQPGSSLFIEDSQSLGNCDPPVTIR